MKQTIKVSRLLSMIKREKSLLDDINTTFIDPSTSQNSKLFASLYNKVTSCTITGVPYNDAEELIIKTDKLITTTLKTLRKLQRIKDTVNHIGTVSIPKSPDNLDKEESVSISSALIIVSKQNKDFQIGYLDRLASDYSKVMSALDAHQHKALDQEKIDTYVRAKLNSLQAGYVQPDSEVYSNFAKEYVEANRFTILDPLKIGDTIQDRKSNLLDYFEIIDDRIKDFNTNTKIVIDLDDDDFVCEIL